MLDVRKRIDCIELLLGQNTIHTLTYAALEARLTIEHLFYERLISSQPYYSTSDLTTWTAAQIVRQIANEANELIDQGVSIYISKSANDPNKPPRTKEDFEALDWVKLGDQAALKVRKLNSLHNALSKEALHVVMPQPGTKLEIYGDPELIRRKVLETVEELRLLQDTTLLAGSLLGEYSFNCGVCNCKIRRKAELLKNDQVISCFNEKCAESYQIQRDGDELNHSRRTVNVLCTACQGTIELPAKRVEVLRVDKPFTIQCTCGADITVGLIPHSWQQKTEAHD